MTPIVHLALSPHAAQLVSDAVDAIADGPECPPDDAPVLRAVTAELTYQLGLLLKATPVAGVAQQMAAAGAAAIHNQKAA